MMTDFRRFYWKIVKFSILPIATMVGIVLLENGRADYFYNKVTTGRKKSMIIGISKSEQGIVPSVLNDRIPDTEFYNFSFAVNISPYGKAYLEAIKAKIEYGHSNSIFILTIDPWSVLALKAAPDDESRFIENQNFLGTLPSTSLKPNFFYLKEYFSKPFFEILLRNIKRGYFLLHQDGWLEIDVPGGKNEKESRVALKMSEFSRRNETLAISPLRFKYFERTIEFLKGHGSVVVVRMPVDEQILRLENEHEPHFSAMLAEVLERQDVDFLDLSNIESNDWEYTDGIHLEKSSAKSVTEVVAEWVLSRE